MLQRIQTIYLLISAVLFCALFFLPLAAVRAGDVFYTFQVAGLFTSLSPAELVYPTWSLMVIAVIIVLSFFLCIFMYRKRILQIRICIFNILLMIGFCVLTGFYLWQFYHSPDLSNLKIYFRFGGSFPIIAIILNYLAIRNIGADETLVRSLNRLR